MVKVGFKETKNGICTFFFDNKMYQYLGVNGLREAKREARKFFDLKGVDIKWEKNHLLLSIFCELWGLLYTLFSYKKRQRIIQKKYRRALVYSVRMGGIKS